MKKIFFLFFFIFLFLFGCINNKKTQETKEIVQPQEIKDSLITNNTSNTSEEYIQKKSKIIEQTISTNDVSFCKNSTNSTLCYLQLAIEKDKPSFCYFIDYGEEFFYCIKNWCLKTYKNSLSACEKYLDADRRLICINYCLSESER